MKFHLSFLVLLPFLWLMSCESAERHSDGQNPTSDTVVSAPEKAIPANVAAVETAHKKDEFLAKGALQFDLKLNFGGKERVNCRMTVLTNSTKALMEMRDGNKIYYIEDKVFHTPGMEKEGKIRFDAYTWAYFLLFPYKLTDPGTVWAPKKTMELAGKSWDAQKLTFEDGTGDSPDDWYIMYSDAASHIISYAAYIVTASQSAEEAEEDPHAIEYADYVNIDGIPMATTWRFWAWRKDEGLTDQLGDATLQNMRFVEDVTALFTPPAGYIQK